MAFYTTEEDNYESGYDDMLETMEIEEEMVQKISTEELVRDQSHNEFFARILTRLDEGTNVPFIVKKEGVLTRIVEWFYQVVITETLRIGILQISHHEKLAGHPRVLKLY